LQDFTLVLTYGGQLLMTRVLTAHSYTNLAVDYLNVEQNLFYSTKFY